MTGKKNYPAGTRAAGTKTDNVAFWFKGLDEFDRYGSDRDPTLPQLIDTMEQSFGRRIQEIEHDISKFRKKNIKGKDYWYFWADGKHNSKGPVKDKMGQDLPDPRAMLRLTIERMKKEVKEKKINMMSCVVKTIGKHAVIDKSIFQKYVDLKLPAEATMVKDMLNYPAAAPTSPGKPDNHKKVKS